MQFRHRQPLPLCWAVLMLAIFRYSLATEAIRTTSGNLTGEARQGVTDYRGVPYAEPPVGDLRWAAPQPYRGRANLDATRPSEVCAQEGRGAMAHASQAEDCLYLNLHVPAGAGSAKPMAVMVWLHGGGFFSGAGSDYSGRELAQAGHVIVVTLNYRLGALGFLDDRAFGGDAGTRNFALLDQQLALQWVHENIAAFGGDPQRVTLFGQSSGAMSVLAHLLSPSSDSLFQRAIVQSGLRLDAMSNEQSQRLSREFEESAGCSVGDLACLKALPVDTVLAHQRALMAAVAQAFPWLNGSTYDRPMDAFRAGRFHRVPVMNGLTSDEQIYFLPESSGGAPLTAEGYRAWANSVSAARAPDILARYPAGPRASPSDAEVRAAQDLKQCTAAMLDRALSRHVPAYAYLFADRHAPSFLAMGGPVGAYHSAELQYLFSGFHGAHGQPLPLTAAQHQLSEDMIRRWSAFARDGRPAETAQPAWARFTAGHPRERMFQPTPGVAMRDMDEASCPFWQGILASPR